MKSIRIGIIGVGNCASALIQGINYYRQKPREVATGLMHWDIRGYKPYDMEVVAALDIDKRKVDHELAEAIFVQPNCTKVFCKDILPTGVKVRMGRILDGFSEHMRDYKEECTFIPSGHPEPKKGEVVQYLKDSGTEILLNYLPVGSEKAARFYAECALEASVAFINNMPVFLASDPEWAKRFQEKNLPLIETTSSPNSVLPLSIAPW